MDRPASPFERILDAHLEAQLRAVPGALPALDARPDPGLWFTMSGVAPRAIPRPSALGTPYEACWATPRDAAQPPSPAGSSHQADELPRRRALAGPAREALRRFRQWGAEVPDAPTPTELKHAFRQLALQFHPDHHPNATASTRAALGAAFHQIHVSYRTIARSLE